MTEKQSKPVGGANAHYLANRNEWNERYGVFVRDAHRWRIIAIASLVLAGLSICGMIVTAQQPSLAPYIVEVDPDGLPIAAYRPGELKPTEAQARAELARWIKNWRTVTPDGDVLSDAITRVYAYLASNRAATNYVSDWYRSNNPYQRAEKATVSVRIVQVLKASEKSWRVEWVETTRDRPRGIEIAQDRYVGLVTSERMAVTEASIMHNPTGIKWTDIDVERAAGGP